MVYAIKERKSWSSVDVRKACIKNGLYTCGDCEEYAAMLKNVDGLAPDAFNVYLIANDIASHSDNQTVSNVMFVLGNEVVKIRYEIEED